MARFKPAGTRKPDARDKRSNLQAIPCLLVVLLGLVLIFMLMYALLTAGK